MVKRGSSQLRRTLYESARLMSIWSPSMRVYFQKKLAEGKHYNDAISHVVRKLVRIIYQLLKDNRRYEEQKKIVNWFFQKFPLPRISLTCLQIASNYVIQSFHFVLDLI